MKQLLAYLLIALYLRSWFTPVAKRRLVWMCACLGLGILTRGERLLAPERLKTIALFNLGAYDTLLDQASLDAAARQDPVGRAPL